MKTEHTTYAIFIAIIIFGSCIATIGLNVDRTLKDIRIIESETRDGINVMTCHTLNDNWESYYQCIYEN